MGSQWPKATAARVGLAQLASPTSRPLAAHGTRGAARIGSAHMACKQRAVGARSPRVGVASARGAHRLTGDPMAMRSTTNPSPWLKVHATITTLRWGLWEVGPHWSRVRISGGVRR
jgi:hypothetical protein